MKGVQNAQTDFIKSSCVFSHILVDSDLRYLTCAISFNLLESLPYIRLFGRR